MKRCKEVADEENKPKDQDNEEELENEETEQNEEQNDDDEDDAHDEELEGKNPQNENVTDIPDSENANKKQKINMDLANSALNPKWTRDEDLELMTIVNTHGPKNWKNIAKIMGGIRTDVQCLHRYNKVLKPGLQKGSWTEYEDAVVRHEVMMYGNGKIKWALIADKLPGRLGKQCRERWFNHLDPNINRSEWSNAENRILFECQKVFGNKWCEFMKVLPGRTENSIKNRWHGGPMKRWFQETGEKPSNSGTTETITIDNLIPKLKGFREILLKYEIDIPIKSIFSLFSIEADRVKKCYYFEGKMVDYDMNEFGNFDDINVPATGGRFEYLSKQLNPTSTSYSEYTAGAYPAYNRKTNGGVFPGGFNGTGSSGIIMEIPIRTTSPYEPSGYDSLMSYRHHLPLFMPDHDFRMRPDMRPKSSIEIVGNQPSLPSGEGYPGGGGGASNDKSKPNHMTDLYAGPSMSTSSTNTSGAKNIHSSHGSVPTYPYANPSFPSQYAFNPGHNMDNTAAAQAASRYPPSTGRYLPQAPTDYYRGPPIMPHRPGMYGSESMYQPYSTHMRPLASTDASDVNASVARIAEYAAYHEAHVKLAAGARNTNTNTNGTGSGAAIDNTQGKVAVNTASSAPDGAPAESCIRDDSTEGSRAKSNKAHAEQGLVLLSSILPPHLRPSTINTTGGSLATLASLSEKMVPTAQSPTADDLSKRASPVSAPSKIAGSAMPAGNDASAKRLINMLHNLKSTASSREPSSPSTDTNASKKLSYVPSIPPLVGDHILPLASADALNTISKNSRNRSKKEKLQSTTITTTSANMATIGSDAANAGGVSSSALFKKITKTTTTSASSGKATTKKSNSSSNEDAASTTTSRSNHSKITKSSLSMSVQLANSSNTNIHIAKDILTNSKSSIESSQSATEPTVSVPVALLRQSMTKLSEKLGFQLPSIPDSEEGTVEETSEVTPMALFPHFKFLHASAQKSLLTQLLSRLIPRVNQSKSTDVVDLAVTLVTQITSGEMPIDSFMCYVQNFSKY